MPIIFEQTFTYDINITKYPAVFVIQAEDTAWPSHTHKKSLPQITLYLYSIWPRKHKYFPSLTIQETLLNSTTFSSPTTWMENILKNLNVENAKLYEYYRAKYDINEDKLFVVKNIDNSIKHKVNILRKYVQLTKISEQQYLDESKELAERIKQIINGHDDSTQDRCLKIDD